VRGRVAAFVATVPTWVQNVIANRKTITEPMMTLTCLLMISPPYCMPRAAWCVTNMDERARSSTQDFYDANHGFLAQM
jgi:hypothetical protein